MSMKYKCLYIYIHATEQCMQFMSEVNNFKWFLVTICEAPCN